MNYTEMTVEELMERRTAISEEINAPEADLDALENEVRSINEELETRKAAEEQRQSIRDAVAAGAGQVIAEIHEERKDIMTDREIRNSDAYIEAFARYITNDFHFSPLYQKTLRIWNVAGLNLGQKVRGAQKGE